MNYIVLIGLIAACITTFSFVPQLIKVIKTKNVSDLSINMYILLCIGFSLWLTYGILDKSLPVSLANLVSLILGLTILILIFKYRK
jgi:MtN3 and saliva related transmembrane protein